MSKHQEALTNLKTYIVDYDDEFGEDIYLYESYKEEFDLLQELVDKYNAIQEVYFKNEPMESSDLNARKLQELYNFDSELIKANKKLKDIIALFVKKFDLSLNKKLKELHFDHTNYEWREINDGYNEEHYYQLTDKECDLVEEVFEEDE